MLGCFLSSARFSITQISFSPQKLESFERWWQLLETFNLPSRSIGAADVHVLQLGQLAEILWGARSRTVPSKASQLKWRSCVKWPRAEIAAFCWAWPLPGYTTRTRVEDRGTQRTSITACLVDEVADIEALAVRSAGLRK